MPIERWGSLSVADHIDTGALAINVMLYDRLVMPVLTEQPDRAERPYWEARGWDPDLQEKRLQTLGDLVVKRPWDAALRHRFRDRWAQLQAERGDAQEIDALHLTRRILADEKVRDKPRGAPHVEVIAAYNSSQALAEEFRLGEAADGPLATQAVLVARRLAVPAYARAESTLAAAIELSRDRSFRAKRRALFDWQLQMAQRGVAPADALELLCEKTEAYNAEVRAANRKVHLRWAFAVCGMGLGFARGEPLIAGASAMLSLVQFATLDRQPAIEPGDAAPAAMFHDIAERTPLKLVPRR